MPFTLRQATAADAPALTAVYQSSFSTDAIGKLAFPRTEATAKFWTASVLEEIAHPNYHFICIVSKEDDSDEEKIVAYAKWNDPGAPHPDPTALPKWPEGGDHELGDYFFGTLFSKHNEILGERKHWYLEILAVSNEYQGKGCGGMLIRWACKSSTFSHILCGHPHLGLGEMGP